ncbi:MAG TPA: hypothetical protein VJN48_04850 [Terriglobales bacterium]|nr:hypothetical protein [Terriglobales bacterium]
MKPVLRWCAVVLLLSALSLAQSGSSAKPASDTSNTPAGITENDVKELRQALAAQQQQIAAQQQQIKQQQKMLERLDQALETQKSSQAAQQQAASQPAKQAPNLGQVASTTPIIPTGSDSSTSAVPKLNTENSAGGDSQQTAAESSLALRYKGITITPGGYLAAETVWRQRGLGADINTPFNSIPFPASPGSNISEFFGSGRQSRISMLAEGKVGSAKLTGFYETDWLSAATTSNNNQSNSYSLRQRQVWGQAALADGVSFTGGQMWSLVTETKKGVDNRTEALPMTIDAQYAVGFSWARQYGFRVAKNFDNRFWLAASVENPQTTFAAHGNANNFVLGAAGNPGGLYNPLANYSFNKTPDFVFKAVSEPGFGHYEVFGVVSDYRDRVYPNGALKVPSSAGAFNSSVVGGGAGANARVTFKKHTDVGFHLFGGDGVGRYGSTGLPDATVRPDGTLKLLRSYQALGTLEFHTNRWDIYFNGGTEYVRRAWELNSSGKPVGYGSPLFANTGCFAEPLPTGAFLPGTLSKCAGDTKNIFEGIAGLWYRFYNGTYGKLQMGPQYSYVTRTTWGGTGGQPYSVDNMVFTSFRYYLP